MVRLANRKIFLSHKSVDKPVIRDYFRVLKTLGFDPLAETTRWLLVHLLSRGILDGFERWCRGGLLVTPSFQDENVLATEVNYAIARKQEERIASRSSPLSFRTRNRRARFHRFWSSLFGRSRGPVEVNEIVGALPLVPASRAGRGTSAPPN